MGTRHLTCVVQGGAFKVAQYGQWDGYPSGQGTTILDFLRTMNREKFIAGLAKTFQPTDEQVAQWWADVGHDIKTSNGFVSCTIADKYSKNHPSLSRDTGGKILDLIQNSAEPVPLNLGVEFVSDSLFCEYAYVVDLDKGTFEVFKGFNKEPLVEGERFFGFKPKNEYQPVKLLAEFKLDALPDDDSFLLICEPQEEEEEE